MPAGRKSKLTDETIEKLMNAIKMGVPIKTACEFAGIGERTYYRWVEKASQLKSDRSKFGQFWQALKNAESVAKVKLLTDLYMQDAWQAKAWILERRWPEEFGRKTEHSFDDEKPLVVTLPKELLGEDEAD